MAVGCFIFLNGSNVRAAFHFRLGRRHFSLRHKTGDLNLIRVFRIHLVLYDHGHGSVVCHLIRTVCRRYILDQAVIRRRSAQIAQADSGIRHTIVPAEGYRLSICIFCYRSVGVPYFHIKGTALCVRKGQLSFIVCVSYGTVIRCTALHTDAADFVFHTACRICTGCNFYIVAFYYRCVLRSFRVHQSQLFFRCRTAYRPKAICFQRLVSQARYFACFSVNGHRMHIGAVADLQLVGQVDVSFTQCQVIRQFCLNSVFTLVCALGNFNTAFAFYRDGIPGNVGNDSLAIIRNVAQIGIRQILHAYLDRAAVRRHRHMLVRRRKRQVVVLRVHVDGIVPHLRVPARVDHFLARYVFDCNFDLFRVRVQCVLHFQRYDSVDCFVIAAVCRHQLVIRRTQVAQTDGHRLTVVTAERHRLVRRVLRHRRVRVL